MYPSTFEYRRANSVSEAISMMQQLGEEAKILSGGHSLIPTMKLRLASPETLIDIGGLSELKNIQDKGDHIAIGSGVTHWMLESSELISSKATALSQAAAAIGDDSRRARAGAAGGDPAQVRGDAARRLRCAPCRLSSIRGGASAVRPLRC